MTVVCRLLSSEDFAKAESERHALAQSRGKDPAWLAANKSDYGWASLAEIVGDGAMWQLPWYFDPAKPDAAEKRAHNIKNHTNQHYLSLHYWNDWSDKRPPLCVICPGGVEWVVDARSSNGSGWTVTGEAPEITCHPSIMVRNYHGWLKNGVFSAPV